MFTENDYRELANLVFQSDYPGYRPEVIESPNGDENWDTNKRYAHLAEKYLAPFNYTIGNKYVEYRKQEIQILERYMDRAHQKAVGVAIALGVPKTFWPTRQYSAMRILEYPAGATSNPHVDFDLFTLMCYRNIPECFKYTKGMTTQLTFANTLNSQIHFGEILNIINPTFEPTEHEVVADFMNRTQYSIVYFAIPDHSAVLVTGQTVGEWIDERISRSRKPA